MKLEIPQSTEQWSMHTATGLMAVSATVTGLMFQIRQDDETALATTRNLARSLGLLAMWLETKASQ